MALLAVLAVLAGCGRPIVRTAPPAPHATNVVDAEVFLIGDAGSASAAPTLTALTAAVRGSAAPRENVRVLFLGDNIYPAGMPADTASDRQEKEQVLGAQIDVLKDAHVRGYFVPGNHDWARMGLNGLNAIREQERFIASRSAALAAGGAGDSLAAMLPTGGCPGPAAVEVGHTARLVLIDSEWWLRDRTFPLPSDCTPATRGEVVASIAGVLRAGDRYAVVAAHHPLESGGRHGGYYSLVTNVFPLREFSRSAWFPLPGVGSLYPYLRKLKRSNEDLNGPAYLDYIGDMQSALAEHPPLVYAAGHEHNLQVLSGGAATYTLVSGAGAEHTEVRRLPNALYAREHRGFMRLTFYANGWVRLSVLTTNPGGGASEDYSMWLTRPPGAMAGVFQGRTAGGVVSTQQ